jgi:Uma2 family endonuclease
MALSDSPLWDPNAPAPLPGEHELPSEDGKLMDTVEHRMQINLLIQSLKLAWAERDDFYVSGNQFVYFSEAQVKKNDFLGPDVFVVLGTTTRSRLSWVAWHEDGKLPDVVIELTSESTRHVDHGEKMRIYSNVWRTPEYFLYDPFSHELEGYRLDAATREYQRIVPTANGDLECRVLGLALGVRETLYDDISWPWLRWLDAAGSPLPTPQDRALAEQARADAEQARADAERARADAERARADAERARADALAQKIRELESKLGGA